MSERWVSMCQLACHPDRAAATRRRGEGSRGLVRKGPSTSPSLRSGSARDDTSFISRFSGGHSLFLQIVPRAWSLLLVMVLAAALLLPACARPEAAPDGEAPIPIAATHREIVVETSTLKGELAFSIVGLKRKSEKDDGKAGWEDRFEEQVESPHEGFVRRRFRVTLDNESDQARQYAIEIDYVSDTNGEVILERKFRKILVPPWTRKQVSGYTPIRADRAVHADVRVVDVTEGQ